MTDFNEIIHENEDVITTFKGRKLILNNMKMYHGPINMQYLQNCGIQSVFDNKIIINTLNGFMFCDILIYDNKEMSSKEFIEMYGNIVNDVLPN